MLFPVMTINSLRVLYISRKLKFQIFLLVDYIETMTKDCEMAETDNFQLIYEKNIKEKLKIIISRHLYILQ